MSCSRPIRRRQRDEGFTVTERIVAGTTYAQYSSSTGTTTASTSASTNGGTGQALAGQSYPAAGWS
jgi:hypothetical protein